VEKVPVNYYENSQVYLTDFFKLTIGIQGWDLVNQTQLAKDSN
jgi:hypothetical protein